MEGAYRFINKLWRLVENYVETDVADDGALNTSELNVEQSQLRRKTHATIKKVTDDIGRRYTFNTAIAANMKLVNEITGFRDESRQGREVYREALKSVLLMLAPILPHVCHVLWQRLGNDKPIHEAAWPEVDEHALQRDTVNLVVQVNGRKRATVSIPAGAEKEIMEEVALNHRNVQRFIENRNIVKVIIVPERLVNIVVS